MSWVVAYVDDDAVYANALARELAPRGVDLRHYEFPAGLIEKLEDDPNAYDLVLVDLNMADTAGVVWRHAGMQVVRAVRNVITGVTAKVCVLSGMDGDFLMRSCQENGADGFIEKEAGFSSVADRVVSLVTGVAGAAPRRGPAEDHRARAH